MMGVDLVAGALRVMNNDKTEKLSRRTALSNVLTYAMGAVVIVAANIRPAFASKLPKKSVNYQEKPKGNQKCSNCSLFEAPKSCKSVAGTISPNGWCSIYRKA